METIFEYCNEDISLIENYNEAINSSEKYDCHHRLEIQDNKIVSVQELKEQGLYFNRPASELIFLKHTEHTRMHGKLSPHSSHVPWNKGLSYYNNGQIEIQTEECPNGFIRGRLPRNKEWSRRISEGRLNNLKPITEETREKLRISHLGYKISNETKKKLSESSKGRKWYNNGIVNKFERYCPEGFVPGKLPHKNHKSSIRTKSDSSPYRLF
jgi:hypothetical protein